MLRVRPRPKPSQARRERTAGIARFSCAIHVSARQAARRRPRVFRCNPATPLLRTLSPRVRRLAPAPIASHLPARTHRLFLAGLSPWTIEFAWLSSATSTRSAMLAQPRPHKDAVPLNTTNAGKTVLITGAGGCIGSALAKAILNSGVRLAILLDHSEQNLYEVHTELTAGAFGAPHVPVLGDISDDALLSEVLEKDRRQAIYHAAACKHVPLMEAH